MLGDDRATLEPYFANIRYLFMVRNPLMTINSMMNRRNLTRMGADSWEIGDVDAAIAEYRQSVLALFSHVASYPDACYVQKFQDLTDRSAASIKGLERYLGIRLDRTQRLIWNENDTRIILTADERARAMAAFGAAIQSWPQKQLTGFGRDVIAELSDCVEQLLPGVRYRYTSDEGSRHFLGASWNALEAGGVWSARTEADLFFAVAKAGEYLLSAEVSCFLVGVQTSKTLTVELNGTVILRVMAIGIESQILDATNHDVHVFAAPGPRTLLCGPVSLERGRVNRLVFRTDDARSPEQLGVSDDARSLGVYLHGLTLTGPSAEFAANGNAAEGARIT